MSETLNETEPFGLRVVRLALKRSHEGRGTPMGEEMRDERAAPELTLRVQGRGEPLTGVVGITPEGLVTMAQRAGEADEWDMVDEIINPEHVISARPCLEPIP